MKKKIRIYISLLMLVIVTISLCACGKNANGNTDVSEEVTQNLLNPDGESETSAQTLTDDETAGASADSNAEEKNDNSNNADKTDAADKKEDDSYMINPFVGYKSTSVKYNITFTLDTDSGISGIAWGFTDDDDVTINKSGNRLEGDMTDTPGSDYYLCAIDLQREFPRLLISRREIDDDNGGEYVFEEEYFNLDMMYPEMSMYVGSSHYIEIKVDGKAMQVYLDSVPVAEYSLYDARPIGQIGTWVLSGDYHAEFDELFIAEGVDGEGEYLYSEDFAGTANIFKPFLKCENGKLNAQSGLYFVPVTD